MVNSRSLIYPYDMDLVNCDIYQQNLQKKLDRRISDQNKNKTY